jgi:ADP-ribosylglycohydrolase
VGAGLEFKSREWIEEHVDFNDYTNTGDGMWAEGFMEGVYTDDTEMTIGLVRVPLILVMATTP